MTGSDRVAVVAPTQPVLRPAPLRQGDRVAVVAPSHPVVPTQLQTGLETIRAWGLRPVVLPHVHDVHGHHAGTDDARLGDLQAALDDPSLRAVWAARGGSGVTRIVDRLDWSGMVRDPKPIIGMSDATALLHAAWVNARLVTVHGQFAGRAHLLDAHRDAVSHLLALLTGRSAAGPLPRLDGEPSPTTVVDGAAEGPLLGGNLSLLTAGIGTRWQVDAAGSVVFVEEVGEAPYAIDRMLTHLLSAGWLDGVAGVLVGRPRHCDPPGRSDPHATPSATADEVFAERLGGLGVPLLVGLPIGHVDRHLALPHGARVHLDASAGIISLAEAVTAW